MGKGGTATLKVDGKEVAKGRIEQTIGLRFSLDECFDVGEDTGTPVAEDYADKMPFRFNGTLSKLVIELGPPQGGALNAPQPKKLADLPDCRDLAGEPGSLRSARR